MMKITSLMVAGALTLLAGTATAQTDASRATTAAMLADAQTRTSLSDGQGAGHDANGFFLTGSGARLNIGGDIQFRYTYNTNSSGSNNDEMGFNIPLARLRFSGNLNENIDYMLEGEFDSDSGNASLADAYAGWTLSRGARFQFGQYRLGFMREVNVAERYQLAVDRSIVSSVFGQGRSQGVQFSYDAGDFRFIGSVSDGFNTANTDFTDPAESDFALTGRVEWLAFGNRSNLTDFTSQRDQDGSLLLGGAFHYQDGETQDTMYSYTGDISWENHGWNAMLSGVGRNIETSGSDLTDYGVALQGGYRVTDNIEPFARYDVVFADSSRGLNNDNFSFITAGVNYYMYGHAAKFTVDAVYSLDSTTGLGTLGNFSNAGMLGSSDDGELALRAQFQLLF